VGSVTTALASDITENQDIFALTASYALGPGIQVDGVMEYDQAHLGEGNTNIFEGFSVARHSDQLLIA